MESFRIISINTGRQSLIGAVIFSLSLHCAMAGLVLYSADWVELHRSAYASKPDIQVSWVTLSANTSDPAGITIPSSKPHAALRMNDSLPAPTNPVPIEQAASSSNPCTNVQPATIACTEPTVLSQETPMDRASPSLALSPSDKTGELWRGYASGAAIQGFSANFFSVSTSLQSDGSGHRSVVIPRYRGNHLPVYPDIARRLGYEGTIIMSTEVHPDGHVGSIRIRRSSGYDLLDKAARKAVSQWTFEPGYRNGVPVTMWVDIPVTFRLTDKSVS